MNNPKNTKRALLTSVLSLLLCCSMLIGTTFAWFTDEVKSASNIITAGNLDVEVVNKDGDSIESVKLFDGILWEPGVVAYENITVKNMGTLALKYAMFINFINENTVVTNGVAYGLSTALKVAIVRGGVDAALSREQLIANIDAETNEKNQWKGLEELQVSDMLYANTADGDTTRTYGIVIYWEPSANDNNWNVNNGKTVSDYVAGANNNYLHIDLGINLLATQFTFEEDSWDELYDEQASITGFGSGKLQPGAAALEIHVRNANAYKVGSVVVDSDSIADPTKDVEVNYTPSEYEGNFAIDAGMETLVYDITVSNLKEGNTEPAKATIRLPAGLDPKTVKVYHYDTEIADADVTYNPNTGYVEFKTTSFSPFTVVYDAESEYVPTDPNVPAGSDKPEDLPVADVVNSPEYENVDLPWGSYGAWSPTEGLDAKLEAAYTFTCVDDAEAAENSPYANWYCDFVVVLDKDLGESEIFLGGNYGSFGWVGFHNGDLTLEANTEIPLLGSVTTNPWTYAQVASNVGTFICGVGDVDDALSGATFTVMLRLTNPEDETEFYNVATIKYTFGEKPSVNDMASLKAALSAGEKEIVIADNITLTESLNASNVTFIGKGENAGIDFNGYNIGGSGTITYKDLKLTTKSLPYAPENGERYGWYGGIDYNGHSVANYENCTITGVFTTYSPVVNVTDCTFNYYVQDGEEFYNIFMYSACKLTATRCTFTYGDRAIKAYGESVNQYELTLEDCKFVAAEGFKLNKALINVSSGNMTLSVINNTVAAELQSLDLYKTEGGATVTVK